MMFKRVVQSPARVIVLTLAVVALVACAPVAIVGGHFGILLLGALYLLLLPPGLLLWGLARLPLSTAWCGWRILRGALASLLALALLVVAVLGVVNIVRFTGDHGSLPLADRYVVVIVADGASLIHARQLLQRDQQGPEDYARAISDTFPNVSSTFLTRGAFTANGISVWPASSVPAHTGIVTGAYPRRTGVMGQRQFCPETRTYCSYVGLGIQNQRRIMSPRVKTLYEWVPDARSLSVLQIVNRGASQYLPTLPDDAQVTRTACRVIDFTAWISHVTGHDEIPRLLVLTLPSIDHLTHNSRLTDEISLRAYLDVDRHVGEIFALYRRLGIYDRTLFVLCADHAMGPVSRHVTLDNVVNDMGFSSYQSVKWSAVQAWGKFEANLWRGTRHNFDTQYDCVPLWGGNSEALLYIKGQRDGAESWSLRGTDAMYADYLLRGVHLNVIQRLLEYSPGIGLVCTNPETNVFHVSARGGLGEIRERSAAGQPEFSYRVLRGTDPLGYARTPAMRDAVSRGTWLSDADWLRLSYQEHYPDALRRLSASMQNRNAATMNIVASDGWDFAPYYLEKVSLVGSHGSLNRQQSLVPIMFYGPGIRHVELPYARTVDIVPTVLAYLGIVAENVDGRPLPVFADRTKNLALAQPAGEEGSVADIIPGHRYALQSLYASYDQQLVDIDARSGKTRVLWPSMYAGIPVLRAHISSTVRLVGKQGDCLLLQPWLVSKPLPAPPARFNLRTGQFE